MLVFAALLLRADRLLRFIPAPVAGGFTIGTALVMTILQTNNYFGINATGVSAVDMLLSYRSFGFHANWRTVLYGTIVLVLMITYPRKFKKLHRKIPAQFVSLVIALGLHLCLVPSAGQSPVLEVGAFSHKLSSSGGLLFNGFTVAPVGGVVLSTAAIALSILVCSGSAWSQERKLSVKAIALGVGNMLLPLFGGMPMGAAPEQKEQATRVAPLFSSVLMLAAVLLLGGVFERIPAVRPGGDLNCDDVGKARFPGAQKRVRRQKAHPNYPVFSVRRCNGFSRTALCNASVCCCNNLLSAAYAEKKVKT